MTVTMAESAMSDAVTDSAAVLEAESSVIGTDSPVTAEHSSLAVDPTLA